MRIGFWTQQKQADQARLTSSTPDSKGIKRKATAIDGVGSKDRVALKSRTPGSRTVLLVDPSRLRQNAPDKSLPGSRTPRTDGDAIVTESPNTECTQHDSLVLEAPMGTSASVPQSAPVYLRLETNNSAQKRSERDLGDEDTQLQYGAHTILEHRMRQDGSGAVELLIHWADGAEESSTWELEEEIQLDAQDMLYAYWSSHGGRSYALFRKPENPPPELYHVYKVFQHERKRGRGFQFEIQSVGHRPIRGETSREPESQLGKTAPTILQDYLESIGGRAKHLKKRPRGKKIGAERVVSLPRSILGPAYCHHLSN